VGPSHIAAATFALRAGLDAQGERYHHAMIAARSAWPTTECCVDRTAGWFVLYADNGVAVISDRGGTIDVTPGFVIPQLAKRPTAAPYRSDEVAASCCDL
jgi:hypothetical protein